MRIHQPRKNLSKQSWTSNITILYVRALPQNGTRTILLTNINIQTSLLLPASAVQQAFHEKVTSTGDGVLRYARVYMKPLEIISGDFLNSYLKAGNIVMLSEGRSGTDNILSLSEGVLRIEVDKPTYEKMGLEGKAVGGDGRKHVKARFGESIRYS